MREASALLPQLEEQLAGLSPGEQALLATLIRQARANAAEGQEFDVLHLFHQHLKADPAAIDFSVIQNINAYTAPPMVKSYPGAVAVELPRDHLPVQMPLGQAIEKRSSKHHYAADPIGLPALGTFLHYAYGIKSYLSAYNVKRFPVRMAPSSGGLQAVDLYLVANQVEGLNKGLYYFDPVQHALLQIDEGNMRRKIVSCCISIEWVGYAPVVFILTCNMNRVLWKYNDRGYRFVHVDAGVLTENMYLVATALGWNVCPLAAFFDDMVNDLLRIDGRNEFTTLLFAAGRRPQGTILEEEEDPCCSSG